MDAAEIGYDTSEWDVGYAMKATAYIPSDLGSGRILEIPANYGGRGSLISFDWTPVFLGTNGLDPRVPQWNDLEPINWNVYVIHPEDQAALAQVGLTQVAVAKPVTYQQPPTASLLAYA